MTLREFMRQIQESGRAWDALRAWRDEHPGQVEITEDSISFDCDESMVECAQYMRERGVL